jgi:tetraacyldisaccharide 4'-kinase
MKDPVKVSSTVVSVGNLTVGGSGKTQLLRYLANYFLKKRISVAVVCRGYGGREVGPVRVPEDGSPHRYGDEAVMLVREGIPVWVSRNKGSGVQYASKFSEVVLLDDGFQDLHIVRDLNLLAIGPKGFLKGELFPRGVLREPLSALRRADAFVGYVQFLPPILLEIDRFSFCMHGLRFHPYPPSKKGRFVALAGIASPNSFFHLLEQQGYHPLKSYPFPDHHPYYPWELKAYLREWEKEKVDFLIMTPKDAVKFPSDFPLPIYVAEPIYGPSTDEEERRFRRFLHARLGF